MIRFLPSARGYGQFLTPSTLNIDLDACALGFVILAFCNARELGIRMALGAQLQHILQAVCTRIGLAVLFGLCGGLIAACMTLRGIGHFIYGVKPLDTVSCAVAIVFILLCSVLAAGIPSRRAVKLDPANALRKEA